MPFEQLTAAFPVARQLLQQLAATSEGRAVIASVTATPQQAATMESAVHAAVQILTEVARALRPPGGGRGPGLLPQSSAPFDPNLRPGL